MIIVGCDYRWKGESEGTECDLLHQDVQKRDKVDNNDFCVVMTFNIGSWSDGCRF